MDWIELGETSAARGRAKNVLGHHKALVLSREEQEKFLDVLINPPRPTAKLKKLMAMERLNER